MFGMADWNINFMLMGFYSTPQTILILSLHTIILFSVWHTKSTRMKILSILKYIKIQWYRTFYFYNYIFIFLLQK